MGIIYTLSPAVSKLQFRFNLIVFRRIESLHHLQIFSGGAHLLEVVQQRRQTEIANYAVKQTCRVTDHT